MKHASMLSTMLSILVLCCWSAAMAELRSEPQPLPFPPTIEAPQDIAYPGTLTLHIATDLAHRIFLVHETIPVVASGPMTLLNPQWIPGAHGGVEMTREMLRLNWYVGTLYPAGYFSRRIKVDASVTLPAEWRFGTALDVATSGGNTTKFKTVSIETPLDLLIKQGDTYRTVRIDYRGGLHYPTLERIKATPALLDNIIAKRKS